MEEIKVFEAPENTLMASRYSKRIFLAGTIEMGNSFDWQKDAIQYMKDNAKYHNVLNWNTQDVCIFNPRRKDWDSNWKQSIDNINFKQQVDWELDCLEKSTHIVMFLDENSKSPISLLELGLFAKSGKLHVRCPEGFYRKGNVDIICNRYNIPQYNSLTELIENLK